MAFLNYKNNVKSLVADNPLAAGATTVNVTGSTGSRFPSTGDFMLTFWDAATYMDPGDDPNMEIVRATARTGDAITIVRAQESTSDVAHAQGTTVAMLITAGTINEIRQMVYDDLSSQCNGANKVFTTTYSYKDGTVVLFSSQFPIIYRPTTDFTESDDKEITMTAAVSAPDTDQTLLCIYAKD